MKALHFLSPASPAIAQSHLRFHLGQRRKLVIRCNDNGTNSNVGSSDDFPPQTPRITPPDAVGIRFRRGSRRRMRKRENGFDNGQQVKAASSAAVQKKWEEMTVMEKAMELYMGEKGILFWLNKFAYASIFIVIGGWILFRFVGPSLNLYQLDTPPLAPTNMFKGS